MNKSQAGNKYYLSLHSSRSSLDNSTFAQARSNGCSRMLSSNLSQKTSVYDVSQLISCRDNPIPKTMSESCKIKINKVLREHRLYRKKYALQPNYLESVRTNLQVEKELLQGNSALLADNVKQFIKDSKLDRIDALEKRKKKHFEAPKPSPSRKSEKENQLFTEPVKVVKEKLKPLQYHSTVLNAKMMLCGDHLTSELDHSRQEKSPEQKLIKANTRSKQFTQHYKDFMKLSLPTRQLQKQVSIVSQPNRFRVENPFEKNLFYQLHIRKDSQQFTDRFVHSFLQNGRLTFNGYLSYYRLFVARTAQRAEFNSFIVRFFMHGCSNAGAIEVRQIKSTVCLLCENAGNFVELREYKGGLEDNLVKTLVGRLADEVTDKHLLLIDSLEEALKFSPNTAEVIFVLMFVRNPHRIEHPQT